MLLTCLELEPLTRFLKKKLQSPIGASISMKSGGDEITVPAHRSLRQQPLALRVGPNPLFEALCLHWTSLEFSATVVQLDGLEEDELVLL